MPSDLLTELMNTIMSRIGMAGMLTELRDRVPTGEPYLDRLRDDLTHTLDRYNRRYDGATHAVQSRCDEGGVHESAGGVDTDAPVGD